MDLGMVNGMRNIMLSTIFLLLVGVACVPLDQDYNQAQGVGNVKPGLTQEAETRLTEQNQQALMTSTPPPKLQYSLERENLVKRLELLNDHDKLFYVYLLDHGQVIAYFVAQGKVSSVSSYLTNGEQIVPSQNCLSNTYTQDHSGCYQAVEAPDLDGSYGTNGEGIFFFTAEGAYVEWKGNYLVSDFPLKINQPIQLVKYEQT